MKTKDILFKLIIAIMAIIILPSCGDDWDDDDPIVNTDPDPEPEPEPDPKPTERGTVIETGVVDLGLSVDWAACNLGAEYCWQLGNYYTFGNIDEDCPNEIGGSTFDWTTKILGNNFITPSKENWDELINKCLIEVGSYRSVAGIFVTGTTQKTIFFPKDNDRWDTVYWTSTNNLETNEGYCMKLNTYYGRFDLYEPGFRNWDHLIRPVKKK